MPPDHEILAAARMDCHAFLHILWQFTSVPAPVKRMGLERVATGAWDLRPLNQYES